MLGAQWEWEDNTWRPYLDQSFVTVRVAEVLEESCDEYYDIWQDGPLSGHYWTNVSVRLMARNKWWQHFKPTPIQVYKIAMTYVAYWDEDGRGHVAEDDMWGFILGDLTWGSRRAEIDQDLLAQSWVRFDLPPSFETFYGDRLILLPDQLTAF